MSSPFDIVWQSKYLKLSSAFSIVWQSSYLATDIILSSMNSYSPIVSQIRGDSIVRVQFVGNAAEEFESLNKAVKGAGKVLQLALNPLSYKR